MTEQPSSIEQWIRYLDQKLRNDRDTSSYLRQLSTESLETIFRDDSANGQQASHIEVLEQKLREYIGEGLGEQDQSMEAGILAALGCLSPERYKQAIQESEPSQASLESSQEGDLSFEAFVTTEIEAYHSANIIYNILAARQDHFSEAFFPTQTIRPGVGSVWTRVDRQELIEYAEHPQDGSLIELDRRNVLDIYEDHETINKDAIRLIPHLESEDDAEVADFFVDASDVPTRDVAYARTSVPYRPLRVHKSFNLISLAQRKVSPVDTPFDYTEGLIYLSLKNLYARIDNGSDKRVVPIYVGNLARAEFTKSHEGMARETMVNLVTHSLYLDDEAEDVEGNPISEITPFSDGEIIQISASINGSASFETGEVEVNPGRSQVVARIDEQGNELDASDLSIEIIGYDLEAVRSNVNWRAYGSLIDTTTYWEGHMIYPGHPMTSFEPTNGESNLAQVKSLINAARLRSRNSAISAIFDYAEQLESQKKAIDRGRRVDITGIGRFIVRPYYERIQADLTDANSYYENAMARYEAQSNALSDKLRALISRMLSHTGYNTALSMSEVGDRVRPRVLIGCHIEDEQLLYIEDDKQLLSTEVETQVVSTSDSRMKNTLFVTFTRNRPSTDDGLSFGVHAYIPELIEKVVTNRNGVISEHQRVVPRYRHIPTMPILARIDLDY